MARTLRIVGAAAARFCAAILLAAVPALAEGAPDPPPGGGVARTETPNVVILLADDLGYGDLGCYGSTTIATPKIDALAAEGLRFTSFYVHAVCSPSRAALLTGRYGPRVGIGGALGSWSSVGLDPGETTIAEVLSGRGYRSGLFGKWHLGDAPEQQPVAQGFDEFAGLLWGPTGLPMVFVDSRSTNVEFEPDQRFDTQRTQANAIDFMDRAVGDQVPFLCIVSYTTPHEPASSSPAFAGRSADGRDYGDAVEEMDASVGAIVDRLGALGIEDSTLVLFLSDNGATVGGDPYQRGSNAPLFGGKGSSWEGGVRVPAIARMPGTVPPAGVAEQPACITDVLPTVAALVGATTGAGPALDGVDLMSVLRGGAGDPARVVAISRGLEVEAVRRGPLKYRLGALYDVVSDPGEANDLAASMPAEAQDLALELAAIRADIAGSNRPAAVSSRLQRRWRAGIGHAPAPADGAQWVATTLDHSTLKLEDLDPWVDLEVVDITGAGNSSLPLRTFRLGSRSSDVRWLLDGVPDLESGPFSIAFWFRGAVDDPAEDLALVDIGDDQAGLSITLGDAGERDDDPVAGRRDDLLVRIGGSGSSASAAIALDLPGDTSARFVHVVVTCDEAEELAVHIDGFERGRVHVPGVRWGPATRWALYAPEGPIGASGGAGTLPFPATHSMGDLAGFGVWDRALRRNEVESQYCRYVAYPYCNGGLNMAGTDARLRFSGSFDPIDERLIIHVDGASPSGVGFLLASRFQSRTAVANGNLCLAAPFLRLSGDVLGFDASGSIEVKLNWGLAPAALVVSPFPRWHFQCWYRDGGTSNFSNGVTVVFCR